MNSNKTIFRALLFNALFLLVSFMHAKGNKGNVPEEVFSTSGTLISIDAVSELMLPSHSGIVLLEVSRPGQFSKTHLCEAQNIWRPDYQSNDYPYKGICPSQEQMEALLEVQGILASDTIVLYDDKGNVNAFRVWWILHHLGHKALRVMDGGKQEWIQRGLPMTDEVFQTHPSKYQFPSIPNNAYYIEKEEVLQAIHDSSFQILDVRTPEEYAGDTIKSGASKGGHIPGSILVNYDEVIRFEDGVPLGLKSPSAILGIYGKLGLSRSKTTIVYCHTGVRSAMTSFVLTDILRFPSVKNYDGSWVEWSHFDDLPIETGFPEEASISGPVSYLAIAKESYRNYWAYLKSEVSFGYDYKPKWQNFFYGLIALSLFFFGLELIWPWRKKQSRIRKDFWLDAFYMFFNVFLFGLVIFSAAENIFVNAFHDFLALFGVHNLVALKVHELPVWAYFLILFVFADFIQWNIHRLLHRIPWLWEFHKLHHSVEEMGFAAHLRFHWMETIVYKIIQALPLTMLGYNLADLFVLHIFARAWGHFNHSNITVSGRVSGSVFGGLLGFGLGSLYLSGVAPIIGAVGGGMLIGGFLLGPFMKYIFNSPEMHIWHHAWELPESHQYGVNFGITLAVWDYLFGTAYIPHDGRDVKLGFPNLEEYPKSFFRQLTFGFFHRKKP